MDLVLYELSWNYIFEIVGRVIWQYESHMKIGLPDLVDAEMTEIINGILFWQIPYLGAWLDSLTSFLFLILTMSIEITKMTKCQFKKNGYNWIHVGLLSLLLGGLLVSAETE